MTDPELESKRLKVIFKYFSKDDAAAQKLYDDYKNLTERYYNGLSEYQWGRELYEMVEKAVPPSPNAKAREKTVSVLAEIVGLHRAGNIAAFWFGKNEKGVESEIKNALEENTPKRR